MKKILFTVAFIAGFYFHSFSFQIDWLVKKATPTQSKGLFCDKAANIFQYGSNFPEDMHPANSFWSTALSDNEGSFLQKFTPGGQLLFTKRWQGMHFFIEKMISDGTQSIYFTGLFSGTINLDGIVLTSRGNADAVVGKIDMNGNVQWAALLGSAKDEYAEGLCFDATKTFLLVTGSSMDSLFVDNTFLERGQQSAFIVKFDLNGNYESHKLYDFLPSRNNDYDNNHGKEVCYEGGFYYWLCDRQGMYWDHDTITAPEAGRYIMKLTPTLDTVWTRYVTGPRCYYGFTCKNLTVTGSGSIFVSRFCSGKYGGDGFLQRYEPVNGRLVWYEHRTDGDWETIAGDDASIYTAGAVDVNAAPGPGMYMGNQLVKEYNSMSQGIDSLKLMGQNILITNIATDGLGNSFVAGRVQGTADIYGHTVTADPGQTYAYFLAKITPGATGILAQNETRANVYPNPANETITVELSDDMIGATVTMVDILGKRVIHKQCDKACTKMDVSSYHAGVYTLEVSRNDKKFVHKIIIE